MSVERSLRLCVEAGVPFTQGDVAALATRLIERDVARLVAQRVSDGDLVVDAEGVLVVALSNPH